MHYNNTPDMTRMTRHIASLRLFKDDPFVLMDIGAREGLKSHWEAFFPDIKVLAFELDPVEAARLEKLPRDYTMKIESATFLANIYLDLGTWGGFTPYVGAGAGMSWQRIHDFTSVSAAATLLESANKWNFAWAYMGGFTFNLAPNLLFDASYRRLELGDAVGPLFNGGDRFTAKDNGAHDFRIGLRYNLD